MSDTPTPALRTAKFPITADFHLISCDKCGHEFTLFGHMTVTNENGHMESVWHEQALAYFCPYCARPLTDSLTH